MLRRISIVSAFLGAFAILFSSATAADVQRQLWVTNAFGDDVHVFEVGTWKLLKTIKVGPNPHGISATADGKTVHIALENFGGKEESCSGLMP
jgi:DNA-binding beta-propeller fold protein YncE